MDAPDDPFRTLGVSPSASLDEARAARRALAFQAHPDRGGDPATMTAINAAFDAAARQIIDRDRDAATPATEPSVTPTDHSDTAFGRRRRGRDIRWGVEHDVPSFTIGVLPAEAFEALLVVAAWIGEVLVDDPPYLLEAHLDDPSPCWCRLELLPDAGATTVNLMVARVGDQPAPTAEEVRDTWVANLNSL